MTNANCFILSVLAYFAFNGFSRKLKFTVLIYRKQINIDWTLLQLTREQLTMGFTLNKTDVTKTGNGEWGMGNGEWGMGNGKLKMGNGKLKMGN